MTDPSPAQRRDWMRTNDESAATRDRLYGALHRPTYARVGAGYVSACSCGCERGYQPIVHNNWHDALDAARDALTIAENGPRNGQERTA